MSSHYADRSENILKAETLAQFGLQENPGIYAVGPIKIVLLGEDHVRDNTNIGRFLRSVMGEQDKLLVEGTNISRSVALHDLYDIPDIRSWEHPAHYALGLLIVRKMFQLSDPAHDSRLSFAKRKQAADLLYAELVRREPIERNMDMLKAGLAAARSTDGFVYIIAGEAHCTPEVAEAFQNEGYPAACLTALNAETPSPDAYAKYAQEFASLDPLPLKAVWLAGRDDTTRAEQLYR